MQYVVLNEDDYNELEETLLAARDTFEANGDFDSMWIIEGQIDRLREILEQCAKVEGLQ